jgi:hypothetical protein
MIGKWQMFMFEMQIICSIKGQAPGRWVPSSSRSARRGRCFRRLRSCRCACRSWSRRGRVSQVARIELARIWGRPELDEPWHDLVRTLTRAHMDFGTISYEPWRILHQPRGVRYKPRHG